MNPTVLNTHKMRFPECSTSALNEHDRKSNVIYLAGIKAHIHYTAVTTGESYRIHYAVLQSRDQEMDNFDVLIDFFKSRSTGTNPERNFPSGVTTWDQKDNTDPINSRKFNILTRSYFDIDRSQASSAVQGEMANGRYAKIITKWFPIKKRISFPVSATEFPDNPWFFVLWGVPFDSVSPKSNTTQGQVDARFVQYWSNVN